MVKVTGSIEEIIAGYSFNQTYLEFENKTFIAKVCATKNLKGNIIYQNPMV